MIVELQNINLKEMRQYLKSGITLANLYALLWWIRHTVIMRGIMLDVVDTP